MDKPILIDFIKKYWQIILIAILIFCLFTCNGHKPENLAITKTITIHKNKIKTIRDTITIKEKQIVKVRVEVDKKIDSIKPFKTTEITNYYRDRYNIVNEIKSSPEGVILSDTIAKVNITELIKYDGLGKELKLTNDILKSTNLIVTEQDSIIDIVEKNNKDLVKAVKKEKRQNTVWKVIALVGFVVGLFIGSR